MRSPIPYTLEEEPQGKILNRYRECLANTIIETSIRQRLLKNLDQSMTLDVSAINT